MATLSAQVVVDRDLRFQGYARIDLANLTFDHVISEPHQDLSAKNVSRLAHIFKIEGCHRIRETNFIDGVVNVASLEHSLELHHVTIGRTAPCSCEEVPLVDVKVRCLNGRHRAAAAKQFLDLNDRWWIVRLFSDDLAPFACVDACEQYINEQAYTDGEKFFKIRKYHLSGDQDGESRWWARLSATKRKDLSQLLKNDRYCSIFDSFLPWPGLWRPIMLGSLHRLLTMKCDEEILNFLSHIRSTWQQIMRSIATQPEGIVDVATVEHLETLAPVQSSEDAKCVRDLMASKVIFTKVQDSGARETILQNLLSVPHMIPSLHTFFEALKYLEPCAKVMRTLFAPNHSQSISRCARATYFRPEAIKVEYGEDDERVHESVSPSIDETVAYHQLWLFTMRNFPELANATPRKEAKGAKPMAKLPSPVFWQKLGSLAAAVGYRADAVVSLASEQSYEQLALQALQQAGKSVTETGDAVRSIANVLKSTRAHRIAPPATTFTAEEWLPKERRCGRPFEDDHIADRSRLYLPLMYSECSENGNNITTMFCKRDMFQGFFGRHNIPSIGFNATAQSQHVQESRSEGSTCHRCHDQTANDESSSTHRIGLQNQLDSLRQQLSVTSLDHERLMLSDITKTTTIAALETRLESANTEHLVLETVIHRLTEESERATQAEVEVHRQLQELQIKHSNLESQISIVSEQRDAAVHRLEELQAQLVTNTSVESEKASISAEMAALIRTTTQEQNNAEDSIRKLTIELETRTKALDLQSSVAAKLESDSREQLDKIQNMKDDLDRQKKTVEDQEASIETYRKHLVTFESSINQLTAEKAELIALVEDRAKTERNFEQQLHDMKSEQSAQQIVHIGQISMLENKMQTLLQEKARAEDDLHNCQGEGQLLRARMEETLAENTEMQQTVDKLNDQINRCQLRNAVLESGLDEADDRAYDAEVSLMNAQVENDEIQQALQERINDLNMKQLESIQEPYHIIKESNSAETLVARLVRFDGNDHKILERWLTPDRARQALDQMKSAGGLRGMRVFLGCQPRVADDRAMIDDIMCKWQQEKCLWIVESGSSEKFMNAIAKGQLPRDIKMGSQGLEYALEEGSVSQSTKKRKTASKTPREQFDWHVTSVVGAGEHARLQRTQRGRVDRKTDKERALQLKSKAKDLVLDVHAKTH